MLVTSQIQAGHLLTRDALCFSCGFLVIFPIFTKLLTMETEATWEGSYQLFDARFSFGCWMVWVILQMLSMVLRYPAVCLYVFVHDRANRVSWGTSNRNEPLVDSKAKQLINLCRVDQMTASLRGTIDCGSYGSDDN